MMYTRTVIFEGDIDQTMLAAHLADCLRQVDARMIEIDQNRVSFKGGAFRLVNNWNVLVPFGFGDLTINTTSRHISYRLSFRQLTLGATALVALGGVFLCASHSWQGFVFLPVMWAWLVGGNLAIGLPRFESFIRRAIGTAPRLKPRPESVQSFGR
jgi:hypothetical protein